ncbi:hypothetical protein ACJ41O_010095 [Fusarium nematophilum]
MHIYTPLQHEEEVRLLRCRRPSTSGGRTDCSATIEGPALTTLNHEIGVDKASLTACPPFVALSYVWGSPDRDYRLTLCDSSLLPITESVAEALMYVLDDIQDGFIWIDQICINQSDTEEKNQQVAKMGDIYRKACKVFVWLGPEGDGAGRVDQIFQDFDKSRANSTADTVLREAFVFSPEAHLNRQAMISTMKLPWFERAWVVQEFMLAREAILAHGRFRWNPDTMFLVTCLFRDIGRESFSEFLDHEISYLRKNHPFQIMRNNKEIHEDFHSLLSRMSSECKVSEPRDLVYAFLALNKDQRIQIRPTYDAPVYRKRLLWEYVLVLRNRRLFVTADSRIGLTQSCVKAGDTIIIAHGSATPLVIQAVNEEKRIFRLIGQCYLEKAMAGEECDFKKWPTSSFIIS